MIPSKISSSFPLKFSFVHPSLHSPHTRQPQINAATTQATPANTLTFLPSIVPALGVLVGVDVPTLPEPVEEVVDELVDASAEVGNGVCGTKLVVSAPVEVSEEIAVSCTV